MTWQPINTAPKDRPIQVGAWRSSVTDMFWVVEVCQWQPHLFGLSGYWQSWERKVPPSHWREVPPPPEDKP